MTLYPNQPFAEGDEFTPDLAYESFQAPYFDDQPEYLGHRPRLLDAELSNATGQIKDRVWSLENSLRVSQVSGVTFEHEAGLARLPDGSLVSKVSSLFNVTADATNYVFLDGTGTLTITDRLPPICYAMARIVMVGSTLNQLEDLRFLNIAAITPLTQAIKVFGGTNTSDKVCNNGEVFDQGLYYFKNFTVAASITITIDKYAKLYCSGEVEILGTVNVTTVAKGGVGYGTNVIGTVGGTSGSGIGAGSGGGSGGAQSYSYAAQPYGSGGGSGFFSGVSGNPGGNIGTAGDGGGGLWIEAAGTINVTGTITAKGSDASAPSISFGTAAISGSGGGSGGLVYLSSLVYVTITGTATIDVRGGNGSNGVSNAGGTVSDGGGAAAGGVVVLASPSNNSTGSTILLSGGTNGVPSSASPTLGGGQGAGFGGAGSTGSAGSAGLGKLYVRNFIPLGN